MKQNLERAFRTALYLAVVVLLNAAAVTAFFRIDLSKNKIHTLSDASKNAVAVLQEPLTIKAFFSKNMPAPYNNIEQQVRDLLEEYSQWGNDFFNYSFHSMSENAGTDPNKVGENEALARSYRIFPIQIEKIEKDEVNLVSAYMGLAFLHGDYLETIPAVTSADRLEFRVTEAIQNLNQRIDSLLNLQEPIHVKLFLSASLNELIDGLSNLPGELKNAVARLNKNFFNRLQFSHLASAVDPDVVAEAAFYRIPPMLIGESSDGAPQYAYAGLIVSYGDEAFGGSIIRSDSSGVQITDVDSMEVLIESSANAILGIHEEIGYVADFGTPPFRGISKQTELTKTDLQVFYPLVSLNYRIKGLLIEEREIPQGLKSLMIVSPNEKFNDWALFQIDQFLMRGGSILMFLDAFDIYIPRDSVTNEPTGQSFYRPRETGIDKLIEHYGVSLRQTYVLDEKSYVVREPNQLGGIDEVPIYAIPIIGKESFNEDIEFVNNLDGLIAISVSPLDLLAKPGVRLKTDIVFSSSDQAWELSYDEISVMGTFASEPPTFGKRSYPLAYLLEGRFESYFANRVIPVKPQSGEEATDSTDSGLTVSTEERFLPEGNGKLFVIGTSTVLGANLLDSEGDLPNSIFLLNILDYMNGREGRAEMRAKGERFLQIEETTPRRRTFVKAFNIAVVPALVVVVGALVWFYWIGRKRKISRRFGITADGPKSVKKQSRSGRRKS